MGHRKGGAGAVHFSEWVEACTEEKANSKVSADLAFIPSDADTVEVLDEMYDKAGKLSILAMLLGDALELYPQ